MPVDSARPAAVTGKPEIASCMVDMNLVVGISMIRPAAITFGGDISMPIWEPSSAMTVMTKAETTMVKNSGTRRRPITAPILPTMPAESIEIVAPVRPPPMPRVMANAAAMVARETTQLG